MGPIDEILAELPLGVWVAKAPSGELVYANREFEAILGIGARNDVAAGEFAAPYSIHNQAGELYPEEQMPFNRVLQQQRQVVVDDIVIHRPDGRRVNIRAIGKPVFAADGTLHQGVIAFLDITAEVAAKQAQNESERQLRLAQRLESVGLVAESTAHDLNNLLGSVNLLTSVLSKESEAEICSELLERFDSAMAGAGRLTAGLLDLARSGQPQHVPLRLDQLVANATSLLRSVLKDPVELALEFGDTLPISGDPVRLEQVLFNLAMNARDAVGLSGRITVKTSVSQLSEDAARRRPPLSAGPQVTLEVSDTGPGVPEALRERVFESYFTTKGQLEPRGNGLGLATVKRIVDHHHGFVEIAGGPEPGATFRAHFPLASV